MDTPAVIPVTETASVQITRDVCTPSATAIYCFGPSPTLEEFEQQLAGGLRVSSLVNHVTRSLVELRIVPDPEPLPEDWLDYVED